MQESTARQRKAGSQTLDHSDIVDDGKHVRTSRFLSGGLTPLTYSSRQTDDNTLPESPNSFH